MATTPENLRTSALVRPAFAADAAPVFRPQRHQASQEMRYGRRLKGPERLTPKEFNRKGRGDAVFHAVGAVFFRDRSLPRSQVKITGVTISTCSRELSMPPRTGVASGFITSAPVRVDHMMGNRPATTVDTVMILGRKRNRAPSITAFRKPCTVSSPIAPRFRSTASSR